jgi:thiaminase
MLCDDLFAAAGPILAAVREHPFWTGLRDGTLPPASLWYFAEQDARYVVPAYARAMARAAAVADDHAHGALLCSAADATFTAVGRMDGELRALAEWLGPPADAATAAPAGPTIHAHTSFLLAAPAASFAAGIGGLLPMTWFHLRISAELREQRESGSRYAGWIDQYCPGAGFRDYVAAYQDMVDAFGARCSARDRAELTDSFLLGARHEWAFAAAAWQPPAWPV